jgi:hypothetical protein
MVNFQNFIFDNSHQLHAICHQRLYESELRFLRSSHKALERKRTKDDHNQIEVDSQFWRVWTDSTVHYSDITKSWRLGQSKLSELVLREQFPQTWKQREFWGNEKVAAEEGDFGAKYRLPLGIGSSVSEAVGFAQAVLREFVTERGINYSISDL